MIRPSSLPALAQCPRFEGGSSEFADAGTLRHKALTKLFNADPGALDGLPEEDADGVRWAVDYIKLHAPLSYYPITFETGDVAILSDFTELKGTPDVICGSHLFDLKWRPFDYLAQMAAYALMILQHSLPDPCGTVTVHILFGESQRYERYTIDEAAALRIIEPIVTRVQDPEAKPTPCDYCSWCAKKLTCSARVAVAVKVADGYTDGAIQLSTFHPSKVATPEEMAVMVRLRDILVGWCDSVRYHADEMWLKEGQQIPGCELKESKGKRYFTDLQGALNASGLPVEKFIQCCTARFTSSKDDPNKLGLEDIYHAANKESYASKAAAKREFKKKMEPFVARPASKFHVVTAANQISEEGEE
jgi:hypothetical protein